MQTKNHRPVGVGAPIIAYAHPVSGEGGVYSVECGEAEMFGEISAKSNGSVTIPFDESYTYVCAISGGAYGIGYPVESVARELPWTMKLSSKATATLKGTKKITYEVVPYHVSVICDYQGSTYKGTLKIAGGAKFGDLSVAFEKEPIKLAKDQSVECPGLASTSGEIALYAYGEAIEAEF